MIIVDKEVAESQKLASVSMLANDLERDEMALAKTRVRFEGAVCAARGISQQRIADASGFSRQRIAQILAKERR
jgi:ParB-like chromosome segregation protein Spo0J